MKSAVAVIPAQAGIQLVKQFAHCATLSVLSATRNIFFALDSRLRENDEV